MEIVNAPAGWYEAPFGQDCSCTGIDGCCGNCVWPKNCEHKKDKWAEIQDNHFPECPMSVAAEQKRVSTLCFCEQLAKADAEVMDEMEAEDRYFEKGT